MNNRQTIIKEGGAFPTSLHVLLLKAALFPPAEAMRYWRQWIKANSFDRLDLHDKDFLAQFFDPMDIGSERMMPVIHKNLEAFRDPYVERLAGVHRHTWLKNQQLLYRMKEVLQALDRARIEHMVLKGIPLALHYYQDLSVRAMSDIDVMVSYDNLERAIAVLSQAPLTYWNKDGAIARTNHIHACQLYAPDQLNVDLHWRLFLEHQGRKDLNDIFWKDSRGFSVMGVPTRTLSPTHQFLHSLLHGRNYDPIPPFRWVADCYTIWRESGKQINWEEIASLTIRLSYVPYVREALPLLKHEFHMDIPDRCLSILSNAKVTKYQERYHQNIQKKPVKGFLTRLRTDLYDHYIFYKTYPEKKKGFLLWYSRWLTHRVRRYLKKLQPQ